MGGWIRVNTWQWMRGGNKLRRHIDRKCVAVGRHPLMLLSHAYITSVHHRQQAKANIANSRQVQQCAAWLRRCYGLPPRQSRPTDACMSQVSFSGTAAVPLCGTRSRQPPTLTPANVLQRSLVDSRSPSNAVKLDCSLLSTYLYVNKSPAFLYYVYPKMCTKLCLFSVCSATRAAGRSVGGGHVLAMTVAAGDM
jgi:hypothetical protein